MRRYTRPSPLFEIGDLVKASNESDKIWEIEGHYYEYMYLHGEEHEGMYYNLLCVDSSVSKLGVEDELKLLCTADFAESYLRNFKRDNTVIQWADAIQPCAGEEVGDMSRNHKSKLRLTKKQKETMTNEVLDRYNDTMKFIELDGEVTPIMQEQLDKLKAQWEHITSATDMD